MDKIINRLSQENFSISSCVMIQLSADEAIQFYADKEGDAVLPFLMDHLKSGPIVAFELISHNAVKKLIEIAGRTCKIGWIGNTTFENSKSLIVPKMLNKF